MEKIVKYQKDYKEPTYFIPEVELNFDINNESVLVYNKMKVKKNGNHKSNLVLEGVNLKLLKLLIDGKKLAEKDYTRSEENLIIKVSREEFIVEIETEINPSENTSLMGLYKSDDILCTQNEPEGFRKITFFIDRPDVMSKYTTKIIADKKSYPYLLSNGNKKSSGDLEKGRHFVTWEDPFPKPCYLFALVAGDFDVARDFFITKSGRRVELSIFVDKGKLLRTSHAMNSLKKSMQWDEERFGLECDLDDYKIVAVDAFNMGAMENKGLNIFNSKVVLGCKDTATDAQLRRIEEVIAHEYFHNWTGNRITCRDWFQLTLKEGLTVFRDHEFSADMNGHDISRIDSVLILRAVQFPEDSGPMAHSIKPNSYIEIDNFYTATVYEKGQEVIRMIQTFIGVDAFNKGITKYFELYDGQAVGTGEFINAMEIASGRDFTKFKNWYSQAGTPRCSVTSKYDIEKKEYKVSIKQSKAPNINLSQKPFNFPFSVSLFYSNGEKAVLGKNEETELVLDIEKTSNNFTFKKIESEPIPSFLRGFSAPVIMDYQYTLQELLFLFKHDDDMFNRYEAGQRIAHSTIDMIMEADKRGVSADISMSVLDVYNSILKDSTIDFEMRSMLISLPLLSVIIERMEMVDIDAAFYAREYMLKEICLRSERNLSKIYSTLCNNSYSFDKESVSKRALKNCMLGMMSVLNDRYINFAEEQFMESDNMTDTLAALSCINNSEDQDLRFRAFSSFYRKWKNDNTIIDNWFSIQAMTKRGDTASIVKELSLDPVFNKKNPNRLMSLYRVFASNLYQFHHESGRGYKLIGDVIMDIDSINPHMSAGLANSFKKYPKLDTKRKKIVKNILDEILTMKKCSKGLYEVASKTVEAGQ